MISQDKINKTSDKGLKIIGIGMVFMVLGFLLGTIILNFLSPSKVNPSPPIPTNYSLEQKNYKNENYGRIVSIKNGEEVYSVALALNNGSIISVKNKQYFLDNTLIDIDIQYIWIFNGENIQYAFISTHSNKTILVDVNNFLKPLITVNKSIRDMIPVIFNSFINIFYVTGNDQECIKIDTRSFEFKIIKIFMNGKQYQTGYAPMIQQGNVYQYGISLELYVIDIKQQLENTTTFNYVKLFKTEYAYNLIDFDDDNIHNELNKDKNYNIFFNNFNENILMFDKSGTEKLNIKDFKQLNEYTFGFEMKEDNKVNLINIAKSVFNDKPVIFSKEINNKQFAKSYFFVQLNNDLTYSIVIYNQFNSLLEIITLDNNLNQKEALNIKNVNDFNFDWLNNNSSNLQISIRPVIFIFQRDCYYITTPNQKSILLWKNEQLIKKYESNWFDKNNVSPFLLALNNVPIIVTKNEFVINDKKYKNETIYTLKDVAELEIYATNKNVQININDFDTKRYETSIIYIKTVN